jgi:anti-sigma-K factor RskA
MTDRVREQLLGYLLGALDDSEAELLAARLQQRADLRRELTRLRRWLDRIEAAIPDHAPPPGLARRTCAFVFAQAKRVARRPTVAQPMTPLRTPPTWAGRVHWLDLAVTAAVLVVAALVVLPAVHSSRFQARLMMCQDNLRQLGASLAQHNQRYEGRLPSVAAASVAAEGRQAEAGIYAPTLVSSELLLERRQVGCPDSPLAAQRSFPIPSPEEFQAAAGDEAERLRPQVSNGYRYCGGALNRGAVEPIKDLQRSYHAVIADAPSEQLPDRRSLNHGGQGQNVLFEDGHVEFLAMLQLDGFGNDQFTNEDHLVAVGVHRNDSVLAPSGTAPVIYVGYPAR